jgi:hypothetical protein
MVADTVNLGVADIAPREIIEDKMSIEMPKIVVLARPTGRNRDGNVYANLRRR